MVRILNTHQDPRGKRAFNNEVTHQWPSGGKDQRLVTSSATSRVTLAVSDNRKPVGLRIEVVWVEDSVGARMSRIVIQNCRTGMFLRQDGTWTALFSEGQEFPSAVEAAQFCLQRHLRDTQVRITFGPRHLDRVVPMRECLDETNH